MSPSCFVSNVIDNSFNTKKISRQILLFLLNCSSSSLQCNLDEYSSSSLRSASIFITRCSKVSETFRDSSISSSINSDRISVAGSTWAIVTSVHETTVISDVTYVSAADILNLSVRMYGMELGVVRTVGNRQIAC